jgi:hypothetical protein
MRCGEERNREDRTRGRKRESTYFVDHSEITTDQDRGRLRMEEIKLSSSRPSSPKLLEPEISLSSQLLNSSSFSATSPKEANNQDFIPTTVPLDFSAEKSLPRPQHLNISPLNLATPSSSTSSSVLITNSNGLPTATGLCSNCQLHQTLILKFHQFYNEQICWNCFSLSDDFTQLTKQEVQRAYHLTDYQLKSLPYQEQNNPHNKHYHAMKLYLLKDVKKIILKKYETIEKFLEEKEKKENERMKRKFEVLEERYKTEIMATPQQQQRADEQQERGGVRGKEKKKAKSSSLMIQNLVAAIKGVVEK